MTGGVLSAIDHLHEAASLFPDWQQPQFGAEATPHDVASLETAAGIAVPSEFREFLLAHRAIVAMDISNGYWLGANTSGKLRLPDLPSVVTAEGRSTRVVPIATDGGGNAFMACVDTLRIWRWNHESGNTQLIAQDFAAFLFLVVEDWNHAANGDADWLLLVDHRRYATKGG